MVQYFIHHGIVDHGKPIKEQRAKRYYIIVPLYFSFLIAGVIV